MSKNYIQAIEIDSIDSAGFTGNLQAINPNGTSEPCVMLRIINNSTVDITISYDGAIEHDFLPASETLQLDFQANALPNANVAKLRQGTVVWVSGVGGGTGLVYLVGYYVPV